VFKLLTLTAKALHLNGEHDEVHKTFDTSEVSIGRHAECDMVLPDPDRRISRMQARIFHTGNQYVVCNASTSNPMYVNGVELSPGSSQAIGNDDELRAGSYVIVVSLAEEVSQPVPLQRDEHEAAFVMPSRSQRAGLSGEEHVCANADPLLALGSGVDTSPASNVNPFADLVAEAAPINSTLGTEQSTTGMETQSSPATNDSPPDERVSEKSLSVRPSDSETVSMTVELSPTDKNPLGTSPVARESISPLKVEPSVPPTEDFDPNDPFGDLLAKALPIGSGGAASGTTNTAISPPQSRQDADASFAAPGSEHTAQIFPTPSDTLRQPGTQNVLDNPLESPVKDSLDTPRAQEDGLGESALSALAGDPFADLMGTSIENHMANAPSFGPAPQSAAFIPDDFNPLAAGGVSQRNSSDPLTPMGLNAKGLADVIPESTIDSIYHPGSESPTALAVDPLQQTQERVLKIEQSVDPLKLFANNSSGLIPGKPEVDTGGSVRDDAREMVASFRAPIPRMDLGILAKKPIGDSFSAPPEPGTSSEPIPVADLPADTGANAVLASVSSSPEVNEESSASQSSPLSADFSGLDVAESEPQQDPVQLSDAAQIVSGPSVAPSPASTKPPADPASNDAGRSEIQSTETLMTAFKRGAGLAEWSATSVTPELMETLGRLLQTAAQGAVALLAARAAIKQEIHLSVTLINPKSNNPLKFLPDGHAALLQMLGPKMPGFMAPVDAMQEAFDDLLKHQAAIAAGTQATIEALFRRFDPSTIESEYPKNGMGERLSQTKYHARLWSIYISQYRLIREEIKDDFFKRLGAEFHDAYNREYGHGTDDEG
jgi:FHA domain-containing protein